MKVTFIDHTGKAQTFERSSDVPDPSARKLLERRQAAVDEPTETTTEAEAEPTPKKSSSKKGSN